MRRGGPVRIGWMEDVYRFRVGEFRCTVLRDAVGRYPRAMFFANCVPPPAGDIDLPYHALLVYTGCEHVLIDAGTGVEPHPGDPGRLVELLRDEGVAPGDVSTVLLSHLHSDHAGGCVDEFGRAMFPNARYVVSRVERDFWRSAAEMDEMTASPEFKEEMRVSARNTLDALGGRLEAIDPETEVVPGIVARAAFGHSPGHVVIEVRSQGEEFLFLADTVVDARHVEDPETLGDTDHLPAQTIETRLRWLEDAARRGCLVGTSHLPSFGIGRAARRRGGWTWTGSGKSTARMLR